MIYFDRISEDSEYKDFCKEVYEKSFPNDERRDFNEAIELQKSKSTFFYLVKDEHTPIGICVIWEFEHYVFIEHLAVEKNMRGKNYGSIIMEAIKNKYKQNIFFEVEPSEFGEIAAIRIRWYEKLGFVLNKWNFLMPSLGEGKSPVVLKIMSQRGLSHIEFKHLTDLLYGNVYSDKSIK